MLATDNMTEQEIRKTIKMRVCAQCGAFLKRSMEDYKTVIVCERFREHDGIARPYENHEIRQAGHSMVVDAPIIERLRREQMTTEIGEQKTRALERYVGTTSLTKVEAQEIIDTIWPGAGKASPAEVFKAVSICTQYGLNPLMRHLYLIPFNGKFVTVLGIGANRLIASRKHAYSYIDETPRLMSDEEQKRIFGKVDGANITAITVLKDARTGATARGYGRWPLAKQIQGADKGNSPENMAFIRSERQALDRLYPAELPDAPVLDEQFGPSFSAAVEETSGTQITKAEGVMAESADPSLEKELFGDGKATTPPPSDTKPPAVSATPEGPSKPGGEAGLPKMKRDPATIKDKTHFQSACANDFKLFNPVAICKELNISSVQDIADWSEAYVKIAAARGYDTVNWEGKA